MIEVTPDALVAHYGLRPLPREGGLFRRTWAGPARPDGRPTGSAIVVLLTADDFSALHRLPTDEIWHFHLGDPLQLLLLAPDGTARTAVLGPDLHAGQHLQFTVPAGTWMGARVAEGGAWTFFGCTMAPGFTDADYEHGDAAELTARYPARAAQIVELCRP
ncbi:MULTISPECIES: cupin domain-containing protein [unclassified Streptomyces]|uniref:cupin domain-containing protein n=1 Tax=unclassified Streptomyces TaxID=2593676 RepID=UPI001F03D7C8|nr:MULTISPECIES: cupin domain-containing protein [unclassified Streptomyces]MCH0566981.1 cupin domain-containing protein [Streptomyces sp. MUM 2J]MCH0572579.1 cupin domain-containing protein [Streptomyces sp. MUM 136J]